MKLMVKKAILTILLLPGIIVMLVHNVSRKITANEQQSIQKYLSAIDLPFEIKKGKNLTYDQEIQLVSALQKVVIDDTHLKNGKGVPENIDRSVTSLQETGYGLCYDRSFAMEQILKYLGYKVRHVAIFRDVEGKNTFQEMLSKSTPSHAVSEVKTQKGWMLFDSNYEWLAVDEDNNPKTVKDIKKGFTDWKEPIEASNKRNYQPTNHYYYGLFSRHGRFFAPYNPIPDYRLQELHYNVM